MKTWKGADPAANEVARQECADASIVAVGVTWRNGKSWRCKRCGGVVIEVGGERGVRKKLRCNNVVVDGSVDNAEHDVVDELDSASRSVNKEFGPIGVVDAEALGIPKYHHDRWNT